MKKMILLILLVPVFVMAQPTITFIPSDGVTLTAADVDNTLAANGLTRDSAFHAISDAIAIGNSAFFKCIGLISVDFPLATTIREFVFEGCWWLTYVSFPLATTIGRQAFSSCDRLTYVSFPLATTIEDFAFDGCVGLTSVSFPLATTIDTCAFRYCDRLTYVNFPLTDTICSNAFYYCIGLSSVNFPLVTAIGTGAFNSCHNLVSVSFPLVTVIGTGAFVNCVGLTSASFGTSFKTETEIAFSISVFGDNYNNSPILTPNIDLTLGEYVLPSPDMVSKIWQKSRPPIVYEPEYPAYVWKSISIHTNIKEEHNLQYIYYLGNNRYGLENIKQAELYDIMGNLVKKYDNEYLVDLNDLSNGIYLLRYLTSNNAMKTEKIVKK